ncbi:MAG: glycosyltransferase family 2 protein [Oligoflexia bacterium]|nr:glycosyltransferase family 2 protein [Oligoflexia bacterium]
MIRKTPHLIIVPAYNEENTIAELVTRLAPNGDLCIVNDCSKDRTAEILSSLQNSNNNNNNLINLHVINHTVNTHIPGAILDGMKYAVENGYEYAITLDAGLSHNPDEIDRFLKAKDPAIAAADLIIGYRTKKIKTPLYRKFLTFAGNNIYNLCLDFPWRALPFTFHRKHKFYLDLTSGYRRYSKRAMSILVDCKSKEMMKSKSFDFLLESVFYIYQNNLTIEEVPISYQFSNSSLNPKVVKNCIMMSLQLMRTKNKK